MPKTGYGLPTHTLGSYADTTVSLPITKAARHITVLCARAGGIQSHHSAARMGKRKLWSAAREQRHAVPQ
jgi:hypothetical protein